VAPIIKMLGSINAAFVIKFGDSGESVKKTRMWRSLSKKETEKEKLRKRTLEWNVEGEKRLTQNVRIFSLNWVGVH
jgi:hypothetical protein